VTGHCVGVLSHLLMDKPVGVGLSEICHLTLVLMFFFNFCTIFRGFDSFGKFVKAKMNILRNELAKVQAHNLRIERKEKLEQKESERILDKVSLQGFTMCPLADEKN
jgi:hypothetical protein